MTHPDEVIEKIINLIRDEGYFLNAIRISWASTVNEALRPHVGPHVDYTPDDAPLMLNPQWYVEDEQN